MELCAAYLNLLRQLTGDLDQLTTLSREKIAAVRQDDLNKLDHVLKQEQAMSLSIRSLEQKRKNMLDQLEWDQVPLSELANQYPDQMKLEAKQTIEELRRQYQTYHGVSETARNTLECNLHEIELILKDMGAEGWEPVTSPRLPSQMQTDIRV
jgi:conjugal transfer/entry exclusion protein